MDTTLSVSHRGAAYSLSLLPEATLALLHARLEELTNVPAAHQKLLYKGRKASHTGETTLREAGLKDGAKVTLLGATDEEIGGMHKVEDELHRKEHIMREREKRGTVKVRSTASSSVNTYIFHKIEPLSHLPNPTTARAVLARLAADPAIQHVMRLHEFRVGVLTELAPHEHPNLLGLNVNAGEAIKLRLRTNDYDGFRPYSEVRRVLCHELSHNVWGDHDNNFKELNSKLNREVAEFERAAKEGTHSLLGDGAFTYEPSSELEAEARAAYVLGGGASGAATPPRPDESPEERRRRVLDATMRRLRKEEEELEHSCGTHAH
ncbi:WLM-domain-containing protein [Artomyces pyxidatus]|uniref:WLM-domain-containing protein n=1 Tax=Artomyces pyxidatus TaxID=48021 RepID=A0ACB8SNG2_9AGAM|nr:WLM-domain-containing protein [Artomyces pyxidatus]